LLPCPAGGREISQGCIIHVSNWFRRTHNLSELIRLLNQHGVETPITGEQLNLLNKYAVTFRYDDEDIQLITREDAANWIAIVRLFAENQVNYAIENDVTD
jgi:hypothetical protein